MLEKFKQFKIENQDDIHGGAGATEYIILLILIAPPKPPKFLKD